MERPHRNGHVRSVSSSAMKNAAKKFSKTTRALLRSRVQAVNDAFGFISYAASRLHAAVISAISGTSTVPVPVKVRTDAGFVESLEDRRLFSNGIYNLNGFYLVPGGATITSFSGGGTVTLFGSRTSNNVETATLSADGKTLETDLNGLQCHFPVSMVAKISFYGSNATGDLMTCATNVDIPCSFTAGTSGATIHGGGANDTIHGNNGNDSITAGPGNSEIWGALGNDTLIAGTGNDTIHGGPGNDSLVGGPGADELLGDGGNDSVVPGSAANFGDFTAAPVTPPVTSTIQPKIVTDSPTTFTAGHSIQVDGLSSGLPTGVTPLTAIYDWNFGDTTSGSNFNDIQGFNAAHFYNSSGTYTITLTITGPTGQLARTTTNITVLTSSTMKNIYVAANGDDANSGTYASPVQSIARADQLVASNTQILFRRGDTFDQTSSLLVNGLSNVTIGAYGTGASPILLWKVRSGNISSIATEPGSQNVTIRDLTFDSIFNTDTSETNMPAAITPAGYNIAVIDNTFLNVATCVDGAPMPTGLLVQGNNAPSPTGVRAYFVWAQGSDYVILGNTVANSTREHIVRDGITGITRINIAYNNFTNLDRTAQGDPSDIAKSNVALQNGSYAYVSHNTFNGGPVGVGPLSQPNLVNDPAYQAERFQYAVFDSNTFNCIMLLQPGAYHTMIRNNIGFRNNLPMFTIDGYIASFNREVQDATFANNTVVNNGTSGTFLYLTGAAQGINLINNLYVAPHLMILQSGTTPIFVTGTDLSSFGTITNNIWPLGTPDRHSPQGQMYVWPTWENNSGFLSPAQWNALPQVGNDTFANVTVNANYAPAVGSLAATGGEFVAGVYLDLSGTKRSSSFFSVGAVIPQ